MDTTRKIAHVSALNAFFAMPASYDPARVTQDDAVHDAAICGAHAELAPLRDSSMRAWDGAIDEAADYACYVADAGARHLQAGRAGRLNAERARDASLDAWTDVLQHVETGRSLDDVLTSLQLARELAAEWGDDTAETKALALFGA
jgi:hypothetical protein